MRTPALCFILGGVLFMATIALAIVAGRRVAHANTSSDRELFVFQPIGDRQFTYADRPVTITDQRDDAGREVVVVRYADQSFTLVPTMRVLDDQIPGLVRHEEWLRVLRFAPRRGIEFDELQRRIDAGQVADRLVVVTRIPPSGQDPTSWGQVHRRDWRFQFHELLPDGTVRAEILAYPESDRSLRRRQSEARRAGRPAPSRSADELVEGSWQFAAALVVMPPGSGPKLGFVDDGWSSAGWALPAAMSTLLGSCAALLVGAITSKRRTPVAHPA